MNTNTSLTNALESDFRAIASQSRATEMKRLWLALWQSFARAPQAKKANTPIATADIANHPAQAVTIDTQLQKAA